MGQLFFDHPLVGKPAPDFTLKALSGQKINLTEYRGDQPVILFFWATWCPHCRVQLKDMTKMKPRLDEQKIKLLLVDLEEQASHVKKYMDKLKSPYDVLLDENAEVAEQYRIVGVPSFFFIDKKGQIKAVEHILPKKYEEIFEEK